MKKRTLSILLTAAMLCSTWQMPVAAENVATSQEEISTQSTENGVTVTTSSQFMTALTQNQSPITVDGIITIGDEADSSGRMLPVMIPANTIIQGTEGSSINSRSPIQLAGDGVTFQNIEFTFSSSNALGSVPHREIFLAGYSLTMDNVSTYLEGSSGSLGGLGGTEEELLPSVYAGGYSDTTIGTNASLTVKNSNSKTMFQAIYMGHDEGDYSNVPYTGDAILNIDHTATVREEINTQKNRSATITVTGSGNAKALTFYGNENSTLTVSESSMTGAVVDGINHIILTDNAYFQPKADSFQNVTNITLNKNACLDLYNVPTATIAGNFSGGTKDNQTDETGILVSHEEGNFTIKGSVSGTTVFQTNNRYFPGTLYGEHQYISAIRTSEADNFILPDTVLENGYSLEYQTEGWVAFDSEEEMPEIGRIDVLSAPSAVDLAKIKIGTDYDAIPDDSIYFHIIWYDTEGNRISYNFIEEQQLYACDYIIGIKTDYWNSNDTDIATKTDWANPFISLIRSEEQPDNYYFQAYDNAPIGDYTFLFCSEYLISDETTTVADVKDAMKDTVKAEVRIVFYDSSTEQENPDAVDISSDSITVGAIADQSFTGNMIQPAITVTNISTGNQLVYGEDYLLTYKDNVSVGTTASVTIIGIGAYTGERTQTFNIVKAPAPTPVTINSTVKPDSTNNSISILGALPTALHNEVVSCTLTKETFNNCISGSPTLTDGTLIFHGGECGTETIPVLVTLKNYEPMTVEIHVTVWEESNGENEPKPEEHTHSYIMQITKAATCTEGGMRTYQCSGCTDSYSEEIPMVAHVVVTDVAIAPTCITTGLTQGSHCATCNTILKAQETIPATGHSPVIDSAVSPSCTSSGLTEGAHCATCNTVLKAQETIPATGHNYVTEQTKATTTQNGGTTEICTICGTRKQNEIIYAVTNISLSKSSYTYNGKSRKPSVVVKDSTGKTLQKNMDYRVSYSSGRKNVGIYTITVTLKGNYTGKATLTFSILPKGTTISKVTAKPKGFSVKWKKQAAQTSGYEIQYSTTKTFTKKTTKLLKVNGSKTTTKTISKLKAKKTYYVRIRTYKNIKVNGKTKKIYSNWSKTTKVITKK